jgi:hypothetical protein
VSSPAFELRSRPRPHRQSLLCDCEACLRRERNEQIAVVVAVFGMIVLILGGVSAIPVEWLR